MKRGLVVVAAVSTSLASPLEALAAEVVFGPNDVATVFFISKSDDRNRVDYGIRLDASCAPVSDDAVFTYWREFERSPPVRTHPTSVIDRIPYGFAEQRVLKRTATGGEHLVRLRQLGRPIAITTKREADGRCSAAARTTVNGATARLLSVHAKLSGPMSVDYIDVHGRDLASGAAIDERIKR
jgi:hypothetical protein